MSNPNLNLAERDRVSLAGFTIHSVGIQVDRCDIGMGGTQVKVMMRAEHDATGRKCGPQHISAASEPVLGPSLSTEELRKLAKAALHKALDHEIDEWLRVDGVLVGVEHPAPKVER